MQSRASYIFFFSLSLCRTRSKSPFHRPRTKALSFYSLLYLVWIWYRVFYLWVLTLHCLMSWQAAFRCDWSVTWCFLSCHQTHREYNHWQKTRPASRGILPPLFFSLRPNYIYFLHRHIPFYLLIGQLKKINNGPNVTYTQVPTQFAHR